MLSDAQLKWRCRRGTKELDYLLEGYLIHSFPQANNAEQALFVELLNLQDPQLILYLLGDQLPQSDALAKLVEKIRSATYI